MGTTASALVIVALLAADARADSCTGITASGGRFAKCFDLGNRLSVTAGTDGVGGSIKLRHLVRFDDEPDLVWKLEHAITEVTWGAWSQHLDGALYRGRFLRHARDGHVVLPFGIPKKIFLPFDIGAEANVGALRWRPLQPAEEQLQLGVVKIAALVDFARTRSSARRFALGSVVRWDVDVDRTMGRIGKVSEHAVSPFTMGMVNLHAESKDGLWVGDVRAEAGTLWHTQGGWQTQAEAEATLERIVVAINDRPIALTAGVSYATATDEAIARIGARVVLVHRNDKRVNLRPLADKRAASPRAPAPSHPAPTKAVPARVNPASGTPASTNAPPTPAPAKPAPARVNPASGAPASTNAPPAPAPVEPAPVEPAPVEPAPVEPAGVEPAPVEPAPVDDARRGGGASEPTSFAVPKVWQL